MKRPLITLPEALAMVAPYAQKEKVLLLGIRGYYKNSMGALGQNDRGIYDDAAVVIAPGYFKAYNFNTDPSRNRKGIATLLPGLHYFKRGLHKISDPTKAYPAFRPATPDESLPVSRDGVVGTSKGIAINIHRGGINGTSSEGCQTVPPEQWLEFQGEIYKLLDKYGQMRLPYILIEH